MSAENSDSATEGWGFPVDARKMHYFRDTMALCRRYGFYRAELKADPGSREFCCSTCLKARDRETR
jgi:hypothetical protein